MTPIRSLEGIRCGNGAAACARAHSRVVIGGSQVGQRLCTRVVDPHKKKRGRKLASNSNVLTPTGMGPTMQVSSSWSYDSLSALPT